MIRVAGIEDDECRDDDDDQHGVAEGQKPVSEMDGDGDAEQGGESGEDPRGVLPIIKAIPKNPEDSNGTDTDMEVNSHNSTVSNLVHNVQDADFLEQLKGIDADLKKYDNDEVVTETQKEESSVEGLGKSTEQNLSGLKSLGLDLSLVKAHDEGKIKQRGWVRRDRVISEPRVQCPSLLTKRTNRDEEDENRVLEVSKKKMTMDNKKTTVEAGSQPCRNQ